jgi:hypothetical protein
MNSEAKRAAEEGTSFRPRFLMSGNRNARVLFPRRANIAVRKLPARRTGSLATVVFRSMEK